MHSFILLPNNHTSDWGNALRRARGTPQFDAFTDLVSQQLFDSDPSIVGVTVAPEGGKRRKLAEVVLYEANRGRSLLQAGFFPIQFIIVYATPAAAVSGATSAVALSTSPALQVCERLCV